MFRRVFVFLRTLLSPICLTFLFSLHFILSLISFFPSLSSLLILKSSRRIGGFGCDVREWGTDPRSTSTGMGGEGVRADEQQSTSRAPLLPCLSLTSLGHGPEIPRVLAKFPVRGSRMQMSFFLSESCPSLFLLSRLQKTFLVSISGSL